MRTDADAIKVKKFRWSHRSQVDVFGLRPKPENPGATGGIQTAHTADTASPANHRCGVTAMDRSQSKPHRRRQAYDDDDFYVLRRIVTALVVALWASAAMLLVKIFCL